MPEKWHLADTRARRLADLVLPGPPKPRGLRSSPMGFGHSPTNLERQARREGGFDALRAGHD